MWVTPKCLRASTTAFMTAGGVPTEPDSPIPFAPKELFGFGVFILPDVYEGRSGAPGIR